MVLYLFKCPNCNHRQEEMQDVNDPRTAVCAHCGSNMYQSWDSLGISVSFNDGFDVSLGKSFNTQRERDYFVESNNLRRVKA